MALKSSGNKGISALHGGKPTSKKTPRKAIFSLPEILRMAGEAKKKGLKIVTTNGCFDILHVGHVRYLAEAKKYGDILIVGVNSDASVRRNKGRERPIVPANERAELIGGLKSVDAVFIFHDETPIKWLKKIKPHVHVKGADRTLDQIVERDAVKKSGGKIVRAKYLKGRSTTNIIGKIRALR